LYWLTVLGLLNSAIAAYYYLRVMVYMYMREPVAGAPVAVPMKSSMVNVALLIAAVGVALLGIFPTRALQLAASALP
jgi:NADH-quinone oxidoreductase subunit N